MSVYSQEHYIYNKNDMYMIKRADICFLNYLCILFLDTVFLYINFSVYMNV